VHSAFGVDHGEVSKAFGMGAVARLGGGMGNKLASGGTKLGARATRNYGNVLRQYKGSQAYDAAKKGAKAGVKPQLGLARGMQRAGAAMQRRPGVTGGVAVGGVGAGAAGVGMSRKKQP